MQVDAFFIDARLVTVAEYRRCVDAGACRAPPKNAHTKFHASGRAEHPMNDVDREGAVAFCSFVRKRLPSSEETAKKFEVVKRARRRVGADTPW